MDAEQEENQDGRGGHGEEEVIGEGREEGHFRREGIPQPVDGTDCHADGSEDENEAPPEGSRLGGRDDLS